MPGKECPCRGCEERVLMCHGQCERYQTWKKDYESTKEANRVETYGFPPAVMRHVWRRMKEGRIRK